MEKKLKIMFWILIFILSVVSVFAEESCGITNFASCLPEKIFSYFGKIVTAPLDSMLTFVKTIIAMPANTDLFKDLWATMVYIISMFYGLMFMWSGFQFMVSGYDVVQRDKAKTFLRNTIVMIVFVQCSYYLYLLIIEISEIMTSGVMNIIPQDFFSVQMTGITQAIAYQLFSISLIGILLIVCLLLLIRFLVVSLGVALFPIAIFCYFVEPLNSYGKLMLNFLFSNIFVNFFICLIILAFSRITYSPHFAEFKIYAMMATYLCVIIVMIFVCWFSVIKSAVNSTSSVVSVISKFKGF